MASIRINPDVVLAAAEKKAAVLGGQRLSLQAELDKKFSIGKDISYDAPGVIMAIGTIGAIGGTIDALEAIQSICRVALRIGSDIELTAEDVRLLDLK
jgi:hypothetical protein